MDSWPELRLGLGAAGDAKGPAEGVLWPERAAPSSRHCSPSPLSGPTCDVRIPVQRRISLHGQVAGRG